MRPQSFMRENRFSTWWRLAYSAGFQAGGLVTSFLGGVWTVQPLAAKAARSAAEM